MDLNPWEFKAPFSAYEYANYILKNDITLILIPMAWLHPRSQPLDNDKLPCHQTLQYWIDRLTPLIDDETLRTVVTCNRTGQEDGGAVYAGTSCALQFGAGEVNVLGVLGRQEGVLTVNLDVGR
jgi:protein N-terminal amidase